MKTIKQLISLSLFALSSTLLLAQVENIELKSFDRIDIATGVEVEILQGPPRAEVRMIKGDFSDLVVKVRDSELTLKFKSQNWGWNNGNRKAKIKVYTDRGLKSLEASAGATVYSDLDFEVDVFKVSVSSGASAELGIEAEKVKAKASSGATLHIEGSTTRLVVDASSGATLNAKKLNAESVDADASSGASITVWASEDISANSSSGASVKYKGNPPSKDLSASKYSGGSIRKL